MSRREGGRIAVYVVVTPTEFQPQRAWHVPDAFTEGVLYARNLLALQAKEFARTFNDRALLQIQTRVWDRKWAIVSAYLKPGFLHVDRRGPAGGAA